MVLSPCDYSSEVSCLASCSLSHLSITAPFIKCFCGCFQVIDETLDVKEMIFNAERVGGLVDEPVCPGLSAVLLTSSRCVLVPACYQIPGCVDSALGSHAERNAVWHPCIKITVKALDANSTLLLQECFVGYESTVGQCLSGMPKGGNNFVFIVLLTEGD